MSSNTNNQQQFEPQSILSVGDHPQPPRQLAPRRNQQQHHHHGSSANRAGAEPDPMGAKQHWQGTERVFYILRGLPGDGIEEKAKEIAAFAVNAGVNSVAICKSEDFLRQPDGSYKFDRDSFISAHRRNYERVVQHAVIGTEVIILSNPNLKRSHYLHYAKTVNNFYYRIETIVVGNPYQLTMERAQILSQNTETKIPPNKLIQYSYEFED